MDHLFREHHAWLRGRLLRRVSCRSEAEDVASETFLQLSEDGGRTDIRDPRAFLTTIAKRVLFQQWRRQDLEQAYIDTLRHMPWRCPRRGMPCSWGHSAPRPLA